MAVDFFPAVGGEFGSELAVSTARLGGWRHGLRHRGADDQQDEEGQHCGVDRVCKRDQDETGLLYVRIDGGRVCTQLVSTGQVL